MRYRILFGDLDARVFKTAIQKAEREGIADPLTAENYWDLYGHTLGTLMNAQVYIENGAGLAAGAQQLNVQRHNGNGTRLKPRGQGEKEPATHDQYELRAREDGFYPVMKRGHAEPQGGTFLRKGEVYKFGTTKNPPGQKLPAGRQPRYTQKYLLKTGRGLNYTRTFRGSEKQVLFRENLQLRNYRNQNGHLPPGNKITK